MTETKDKSMHSREQKRAMDLLAQIGGAMVKDDDLVFEGNKFIIPSTMSVKGAVRFLVAYDEQNEEETSFSKVFNYRPFDGANALDLALREVFGTSGIAKGTMTMFGKIPPELKTIKTSCDETKQIPWGKIQVPMIEGELRSGATITEENGLCYEIRVTCKRRYKNHVEGLFKIVQKHLEENSIYRGKAFNGSEEPDFIDVNGIDEDRIIFSDDAMVQLDANLWSILEKTDRMREMNLPMKRVVLLEGPYGTGKTSAAFITAKKAEENGWTFIYCRPAKDKLSEVMNTAKLYSPAVVFFEDIDVISNNGDDDNVTQLLDMFDGINAKGGEIMAVLTTNHVESIHKGMVRPGRLDSIIHIGHLDRNGIERLIRSVVDPKMLDKNTDFDLVADSMTGYLPAYIKESVERAVRYSIASTSKNSELKIGTDELVNAALGLRPQYNLMEGAGEGKDKTSIESLVQDAVADVIHGAAYASSYDPDDSQSQQTTGHYAASIDVKKNGKFATAKSI